MYLHFEDAAPEFTLKVAIAGGAVTVGEALGNFALAYGATGYELSAASLELVDESGRALGADAVLPCGLPTDADAFVLSRLAPAPLAAEAAPTAAAAAKAATVTAARPAAAPAPPSSTTALSEEERRQKGVYAKPGSAVAASQAKMGENSYYYSVGKNRPADPTGVVTPSVPVAPRQPKAVSVKPQSLPEVSITSYSMIDDEDFIKVQVPFAGAGSLAEGAIACNFRIRSFDLRIANEGKQMRLHIPLLCQEIDAARCSVKKRAGKLIVVLAKNKPEDPWFELRKTKGVVRRRRPAFRAQRRARRLPALTWHPRCSPPLAPQGDSEYNKLKFDDGEPTAFTL